METNGKQQATEITDAASDLIESVSSAIEHVSQRRYHQSRHPPDQAPEGWTPRTKTWKIVDRNPKKDSTLKRDVERWMDDLKEKNKD